MVVEKFILNLHSKIVNMKYHELEKKLKEAGCYQVGSNRHPFWYSPITKMTFQTSHHGGKEVATGTLKKIMKDAGIE